MNDRRIRILLVDDEPMIVETLKMLLELETDWAVDACTHVADALDRLSNGTYDVVVSDFLMPEMDGVALLARVRAQQPQASRILLTGYADKGNAIRSINEVGLYHYLEKPWDNEALLLVLRNAAERARLLRDIDDTMKRLEASDRRLAELRARLIREFL